MHLAPFTRGGGHPPRALTKGYIYMWRRARRRAIVGISLSPGLLPSARASRAAGEENVGHLPRGCHWFETGARTDRSLSSRAENADRDNRQKNISLHRNVKRLLSYILCIPTFGVCPWYCAYMHINTEIIFPLLLCFYNNIPSVWQRDKFLTCTAPI